LTTRELIRQLRERDIRLSVDGDRLRSSAPKGRLTPDLAKEIAAHKPEIIEFIREVHAETEPLARISRDEPLQLSFAQERLWFLNRLQPDSTAYNITAVAPIPGSVDSATLEQAANVLAARHENLRTAFTHQDGRPVVLIVADLKFTIAFEDLAYLPERERAVQRDRLVQRETSQPFDLTCPPLFRITLVRLGSEQHSLVLAIHHIISDAWSVGVFFQELGEIYIALKEERKVALPALAVQYADYAAWQRKQLTSAARAREIEYWKQKLAGASGVLALPTDRPRPPIQSFAGDVWPFQLSAETSASVKRLARETGATVFMTLLAIFKILLFRYTRQSDILVGTAVENRLRPELEPLIGLLVNTLVLRDDLTSDMTARQLLSRVCETVLDAHAHQNLPFENLVQCLEPDRTLAHSPLFQVAFLLQNTHLSSAFETTSRGSTFDLSLYMWEGEGSRFYGAFEYSSELFDKGTIDRMAAHFAVLAEAIPVNPDGPIGRLPILTAYERKQLLETWNQTTTAYPRNRLIHDLFSAQAAVHAQETAVVYSAATGSSGSRQILTYAALETQSNRLARYLRSLGACAETRIAVALERSPGVIVTLLAILKTGGAYVPLDPTYPAERLAFMLEDAEASILVTLGEHRSRFPNYSGHVVCLDADSAAICASDATPPVSIATPETLAYIMYTSGSTGRPKGVAVPHRAVVRLVKGTDYARFGPEEIFLACAPISFDASTFEIWGSLLNGGKLVLSPHAVPTPKQLADMIVAHGITTMWLTAGLFHQMVEAEPERLASVQQILAGGDVLSPSHVNRLLECKSSGIFINGYGPTENTTFTCCYRMTPADRAGHTVPIGRPIANTRAYVLDAAREPTPVGVPGELFIGGDGLARNYWRRDDLTAQKFVDNPFGSGRLYRTGDLVRYRPDGSLEFLGRTDNQVKIRGFRIELEEIENVLCRHPAVRDAAVAIHRDKSGANSLDCYVVPRTPHGGNAVELRRYLADRLPDYMIPSIIVELDSLPLTSNGKVDRKALPEARRTRDARIGPRTSLEKQLLSFWEHVLDIHGIGIRDNFFDLGGHSLLAVRLFARLEKIFGGLPLSMLFQAPTIEQMAAKLNEGGFAPQWHSLVPIQPGGSKPPLVLVPGIGGNVICYSGLASLLGPECPVYGLQSLGLDGVQAPLERIEDMAAHFIKEVRTVQAEGPYFLGGVCMGGIVAFEMAQQLRSQGQQIGLLALMETWPPQAIERPRFSEVSIPLQMLAQRAGSGLKRLTQSARPERWPFLSGKLGVRRDASGTNGGELFRQRVAAANYRAALRYKPEPYRGRVLLVLAGGRMLCCGSDPRLRWAELAGGNCIVRRVPAADSGWLLKEPHVHALAGHLRTALEQSIGSPVAQRT
jgi:aspartate racemase